jgi:hypothetical protein
MKTGRPVETKQARYGYEAVTQFQGQVVRITGSRCPSIRGRGWCISLKSYLLSRRKELTDASH